MQQTTNPYSQPVVNQITDECCTVIEDLMADLGVGYTRGSKRLFGCCPIHGGDNQGAWSLYPDGLDVRGIWFCRTRKCHEKWRKTLVGFVHGVLTVQRGDNLKWTDAVDYMVKFLGYNDISEIKPPDADKLARQQYARISRRLTIDADEKATHTWTRDHYLSMYPVPAQYYVDRGYNPEILKRYDVGYAARSNRAVVPVYDRQHEKIVGMSARSLWDKCTECGLYHNPKQDCPSTPGTKINASKWKNSPGFESAHFLYNLWFAQKSIMETKTMIIVEGPGDVWKLEEAGIENSVAIFGTDITEEQMSLIEQSYAMNVIVLTDNDEAGWKAADNIKQALRRTHRLYFPRFLSTDVGDLNSDAITKDMRPILREIAKFDHQILGASK